MKEFCWCSEHNGTPQTPAWCLRAVAFPPYIHTLKLPFREKLWSTFLLIRGASISQTRMQLCNRAFVARFLCKVRMQKQVETPVQFHSQQVSLCQWIDYFVVSELRKRMVCLVPQCHVLFFCLRRTLLSDDKPTKLRRRNFYKCTITHPCIWP